MVELNYSPGDVVRFRLSDKELDGTVLESHDKNIVLIKLDSGYNIGINKENILAARALSKYKEDELAVKEELNFKNDPKLPSIGIIITGGTIASKLDTKTGGVKPLTSTNDFFKFYPELANIVNVKTIEVPFLIASESMASENWIKIAEVAKPMLDDPQIKGIVITHGTDTLGYTAAALSFFLRNLNKPVVLTYSQRSIDRASSDARLNLSCAARMAISDCAEVMTVGHASINDDFCYAIRGTKVRKMHSSRRDAFQPINSRPIAKVWEDKVEFLETYNKRDDKRKVELDASYSDKVGLIKFYPGQDSSILDFYALSYKGVVIEGTGFGHLPVNEAKHNWLPKLKKHIKDGLVVCISTQTVHGGVNSYVYTNLRELSDAGVIFVDDMISETALVKLGWILGHYGWKTHVKDKMLQNVAGEISESMKL